MGHPDEELEVGLEEPANEMAIGHEKRVPIQLVSVIVCSLNGAARLPRLIRSLHRLKTNANTDVEIVFVDSCSDDDSGRVVKDACLPFRVRTQRMAVPGQSIALNRAIDLSEGQLLLFTDDDCEVDSNWATAFLDATLRFPNAGYFFGKVIPLLPSPTPDWWHLAPRSMSGRDQGSHLILFSSFNRGSYPIGCNMAIRRSAFGDEIRFDERLGPRPGSSTWLGADTKLGRDLLAAGLLGCYVPKALVFHSVEASRVSWRYVVSHARASGRCSHYYRLDHHQGIRGATVLAVALLELTRAVVSLLAEFLRGKSLRWRRERLRLAKATGRFREALRAFLSVFPAGNQPP